MHDIVPAPSPVAVPGPHSAPVRVRESLALTLGPAVFLLQFAAVYGWTALACRFGWGPAAPFGIGMPMIPFGAIVLTVLLALVVWVGRPRRPPPVSPGGEELAPAPLQRFLAVAARRVAALSIVAMICVAATTFAGGGCQ